MHADFVSMSFIKMSAISGLNLNWAHKQAEDNLCNLIKESLSKQWIYKFPMTDWYRTAESIANMATIKNNLIWIKKNGKLLLYVPFEIRQQL